MPDMIQEALAAAYADALATGAAVAVVHGADTAPAFFNTPEQEFFEGAAQGVQLQIRFIRAALPGVANGENLTVGGVAYVVNESRLLSDGLEKMAWLKRTAAPQVEIIEVGGGASEASTALIQQIETGGGA